MLDVFMAEFFEALSAEFLYTEGSHGRAVYNSTLHIVVGYIAGLVEVAAEASRKGIAGTGGVKDLF